MRKTILVLLMLFILLQNGCVEKKTIAKNASHYLTYNIGSLPNDLSFPDESDINSNTVLQALFSTLIEVDSNNKIVPGLAESYTISPDGLIYTFKLRKEALWSNGESITSEDVISFFKYILAQKSAEGNSYGSELFSITGSEPFNKGDISFQGVGITSIDDESFFVRLMYPCKNFLQILSQPQFAIRDTTSLKSWQSDYKTINYSGPFIADKITPKEIYLKKNQYYWDMSNIKENNIILKLDSIKENALASFDTDNTDIFTDPPLNEVTRLKAAGNTYLSNSQILKAIQINMRKKGILNQVEYRRAISDVLDRNNIIKGINGQEGIKQSFLEKELGTLTSVNMTVGTKTLSSTLEDYMDKKINLNLVFLDTAENNNTAKIIKKSVENLNDKLKLEVNVIIKAYDEENLKTVEGKGDYDLLLKDYIEGYDSPLSMLYAFTASSRLNLGEYVNKAFDLSYKESMKNDSVKAPEDMFFQDMPIIPLYIHGILLCKDSSINGLTFTSGGSIILKDISIN